VSGGETVGIGGSSCCPARSVDVSGGQVLAERHHSTASVEGIAKGGSRRGRLRRADASISGGGQGSEMGKLQVCDCDGLNLRVRNATRVL
jgi:hypothetical protein